MAAMYRGKTMPTYDNNIHSYEAFDNFIENGFEWFEGSFLSLPNCSTPPKAKPIDL